MPAPEDSLGQKMPLTWEPKRLSRVSADALRRVAGGAGVLVGGEQADAGKVLLHDLEEAGFALLGAGGADLQAEHDDIALAAEHRPRSRAAMRPPSRLSVEMKLRVAFDSCRSR
jgi:hypothetical protein